MSKMTYATGLLSSLLRFGRTNTYIQEGYPLHIKHTSRLGSATVGLSEGVVDG